MNVKGILNVSRRVNSGFLQKTLTADLAIPELSYDWLSLIADTIDRTVTLPDATSLQLGWSVTIHNNGDTYNILVNDNSATQIRNIKAVVDKNDTKVYKFVLIDNSTIAGVWKVMELGEPSVKADRYIKTFVGTDWTNNGTIDFPELELEILETEHSMGENPIWNVFDSTGIKIILHNENVDASGNISLTALRDATGFDGKVIIV